MTILKSISVLALAVPAVGLLAFGPRAGHAVPQGDGTKPVVVVEYWEKWTGAEAESLLQSVADFNNTVGREKGIYVNCLSASSITQKTLVATAGGVPPDIAGLWDANVAQFAALGALMPLDGIAAAHGITAASYKKVFWDECRYDGTLYALVSTPYDYVLHYNTRLFAESADKLRAAGCDPTRPPRTIAELDAYARALDRVEGKAIKVTGYLPTEPGWDLSYIPFYFGGSWWDEAHKKFTFTDPKVVEAFTWVQGYSKRLGKAAVSEFRSGFGNYDSPQNPFMSGTTAIVSQGTFLAQVIRHQAPSLDGHWAAAPFPTAVAGLSGVTTCQADVLVIPKGARHPKEAFEFLAYLNTQGPMEKLCNAHCKISPLSKVSDEFYTHHNNPYVRVFEELADGPHAYGTPSIPTFSEVSAEMGNFMTELAAMRVTPEDGLKDLQTRMQAKYDLFMATQDKRGVGGPVDGSDGSGGSGGIGGGGGAGAGGREQ